MYYSFKGLISLIEKDYIVIEVGDIGYQVYVSRIEDFTLGEETKIYLSNVVREDEQFLVGFKEIDEKKAFESLIKVKGIGPRIALAALSKTTPKDLFLAISANNISYLKRLPNIGTKAASQIILDLKGDLEGVSAANPNQYEEVRIALKELGFKNKVIDDVLASINLVDATNEMILKEALKRLSK